MKRICEVSADALKELAGFASHAAGQTTDPVTGQETAVCPVDAARRIAEKALEASCGKGVMCRDGLRQISLIVGDIANGKGESDDLEMLEELLGVIKECADCELSYTAAEQILSLLQNYQDEWRMHITRKRCKYRVCVGCTKPEIVPETGTARKGRRKARTGMVDVPAPTPVSVAVPVVSQPAPVSQPVETKAEAPAETKKPVAQRPQAAERPQERRKKENAKGRIIKEDGKMKRMEADVVVIACGMSGLAALTQAQESLNASGGGVAVAFEKSGTSGGAANMGMALLAFESQMQKEAMVNDFTKDDAFRFFMEYVHWRSNARLVRRWFDQSSETIEWLQDKGVEFLGVYKYFKNSHCTQHMVKAPGSNKPSERCASIMNRILTEYAQEIGAEIYFNTPVKKILTGSKGQVRGVIAVDANGEEIECLCNAVIVATGGIGNNVDMIYQHMGWKWGEDMFTFRIPGIDGDGINMAWDIGAKKAKINMEVTYNTPGTTDIFKTLSETMRQPNLMVNLDGKRFINEEIMDNTTYTGNSLLQQKGHTGFSIIDSTIVDYYKKHGLDYITYHHAIKTMDKWDEELDLYLNHKGIEANGLSMLHEGMDDQESGQVNFWKFDTLEELCEVTGINYKNLLKTIEEYNQMCNGSQRGYDWQFTKDHRFLKPILKAPYFVARHFPSGYGSLGGLEVNENMEVLNDEFAPIPGLYACGNDTATVFADSYCFYNPGSTMSYAINSGRIAAKESVAYIDSDEFIDPEE